MKEQMTSRERVMTALNLGQPDRVPWVEVYVQNGIASSVLGRECVAPLGTRFSPEIFEVLALDNITYHYKTPLYAEMVTYGENAMVKTPWLKTWEDVEKLKKWLPDSAADEFYVKAKEYLKFKGDKAAMCCVNVGLSPTFNSMGYEDFIYNLEDEPELVLACFEVFGEWNSKIIDRVNHLGYDIYFTPEDLAFTTGLMITPAKFEKYIFPFLKKMYANFAKPVIYHSDGNYIPLMDYILQLDNVKALANLEPPGTDIFKVKEMYGDRVCLYGNIDLHHTLTRGTVEETIAEVKEKLERVGKGGGYIIASSNGLVSYCLKENVLAMNDTILKYGYYEK